MQWIRSWMSSAHSGLQRFKNTAYSTWEQATHLLGTFYSHDAVKRSIQYTAGQLAEGIKAVATFPLTVCQMPFHKESRDCLKHAFQYNVLYYLIPVVTYYGAARPLVEGTLNGTTAGLVIPALDTLMTVVFLRQAANTYLMNVLVNNNAATISLETTSQQSLPSCQCEQKEHLQAAIMSPLYYLTKVTSVSLLATLPKIGGVFEYFFKPLSYGESLHEVKLGGLCNKHRIEYFSEHAVSSYGMGIASLLALKSLNYLLYSYTGVYNPWAEDAMFNFIFPLIVFHMHNHALSNEMKPGLKLDLFFPLRGITHAGMERFHHHVLPRLMDADQKGKLLEYLAQIAASQPLRGLKQFFLYPSLRSSLTTFVQLGPTKLFIGLYKNSVLEKLEGISFVLKHPDLIQKMLSWYQWLPFVPPSGHIQFVVKLLTRDTAQSNRMLQKLKSILECSQNEAFLSKPEVTWHIKRTEQGETVPAIMFESYMQARQDVRKETQTETKPQAKKPGALLLGNKKVVMIEDYKPAELKHTNEKGYSSNSKSNV